MKSTLILLILIAIFGGFIYWYVTPDICENPIPYHISQIDPEFGLSEEELKAALTRAENIWEAATFLSLFNYTDSEGIEVKLIFDERQADTYSEQNSKANLETAESVIDNNNERYDILVEKLERDEQSYANALESYNRDVAAANAKGGAPPPEYKKLEERRKDLNRTQADLNSLVNQINQIAENIGQQVDTFNEGVAEYNQDFAVEREFDQGHYDSTGEIVIYQYDSLDDLTLVLAHELGHALGMEHVINPEAIMNAFLTHQDTSNLKANAADLSELGRVCKAFAL